MTMAVSSDPIYMDTDLGADTCGVGVPSKHLHRGIPQSTKETKQYNKSYHQTQIWHSPLAQHNLIVRQQIEDRKERSTEVWKNSSPESITTTMASTAPKARPKRSASLGSAGSNGSNKKSKDVDPNEPSSQPPSEALQGTAMDTSPIIDDSTVSAKAIVKYFDVLPLITEYSPDLLPLCTKPFIGVFGEGSNFLHDSLPLIIRSVARVMVYKREKLTPAELASVRRTPLLQEHWLLFFPALMIEANRTLHNVDAILAKEDIGDDPLRCKSLVLH